MLSPSLVGSVVECVVVSQVCQRRCLILRPGKVCLWASCHLDGFLSIRCLSVV